MYNGSHGRKDRLVEEHRHDAYHVRTKLPDPTVCPACGAVYRKGRWTWGAAPEGAREKSCPACRRTADGYPAGHIELRGNFLAEHRSEIMNLVKNVEEREKGSHPMERIMAIKQHPDCDVVTTTGIHVAREIGSSLKAAYGGKMSVHYLDDATELRIRWVR